MSVSKKPSPQMGKECLSCGTPIEQRRRGRPRLFCSHACLQRDHRELREDPQWQPDICPTCAQAYVEAYGRECAACRKYRNRTGRQRPYELIRQHKERVSVADEDMTRMKGMIFSPSDLSLSEQYAAEDAQYYDGGFWEELLRQDMEYDAQVQAEPARDSSFYVDPAGRPGAHPCWTCNTNWVSKKATECSSCRSYRSRTGKERPLELARRVVAARIDRGEVHLRAST